MVDISTTLAAVSQGISLVRELNSIDRELDNAAVKLKVAELSSLLADTKIDLADIKLEFEETQRQIQALRDQFKRKDETVEHSGFKYDRGTNGNPIGRPYCPVCIETSSTLIALDRDRAAKGMPMTCNKCKAKYSSAAVFPYEET